MAELFEKKKIKTIIKNYPCETILSIGVPISIILSILDIINYETFIIFSAVVWIAAYWFCTKKTDKNEYPISKKTFLFLAIVELLFMFWDLF